MAGRGGAPEPGLDRSRAFPSAAQGDSGWHGPVGRRGGLLAQNSGCSLGPGWGQGPQSLPVRSTNRAKALWSLEPRCTEATTQHTVRAPVAPPTGQGLLPQPWIPRLESLCLQTQGVHCPSRAPGSKGRNGEGKKRPRTLVAPEHSPAQPCVLPGGILTPLMRPVSQVQVRGGPSLPCLPAGPPSLREVVCSTGSHTGARGGAALGPVMLTSGCSA